MKSISDAIDKVRRPYLEDRFGYDLGSSMGSAGRTVTRALVRAIPGGRDTVDDTASFVPAPDGPARFLEVGFGDGRQLDLMKALGWEVVGVDPDPKSVETACGRGLDARVGTLESERFDDGEFDAVYLSHLIEHVHDPRALLTECHRVLRPGGHLVVLTPNVNCHIHERYRSAWFSLQAPFHLVLFTPEAMKTTFEKAGFTVTKAATSSRRAMVHNIGSLDLRDSSGGLPSFDGRVPLGRLVRGVGAQFGESTRIALGYDAGEELVFVGQRR
jgi:SAM-dependent methyltransferase